METRKRKLGDETNSVSRDALPAVVEWVRICKVCHKCDNGDLLLDCSRCDAPQHTYCVCVDPVEGGKWKCANCAYPATLLPPKTPADYLRKPFFQAIRASLQAWSSLTELQGESTFEQRRRERLLIAQDLVRRHLYGSFPSLQTMKERDRSESKQDWLRNRMAREHRQKISVLLRQPKLDSRLMPKDRDADGVETTSDRSGLAAPTQKPRNDQKEAHIASKAGGTDNYGISPSPLIIKTPFSAHATTRLYITSTISQDCTDEGSGCGSLLIAIKEKPRNLAFKSTGFEPGSGKRLRLR